MKVLVTSAKLEAKPTHFCEIKFLDLRHLTHKIVTGNNVGNGSGCVHITAGECEALTPLCAHHVSGHGMLTRTLCVRQVCLDPPSCFSTN